MKGLMIPLTLFATAGLASAQVWDAGAPMTISWAPVPSGQVTGGSLHFFSVTTVDTDHVAQGNPVQHATPPNLDHEVVWHSANCFQTSSSFSWTVMQYNFGTGTKTSETFATYIMPSPGRTVEALLEVKVFDSADAPRKDDFQFVRKQVIITGPNGGGSGSGGAGD